MDRERNLVELVDEHGTAVGSCTVAKAHTSPGLAHRAYSVLLYDPAGRILLQQRAPTKLRFGALWSNTCCGHPAPGQDVAVAAATRLTEELGLDTVPPLREAGAFRYRATDPTSSHTEHEWDHVLVGTLTAATPEPSPDPTEVAELAWLPPDTLRRQLETDPYRYTPWLPDVLRLATTLA